MPSSEDPKTNPELVSELARLRAELLALRARIASGDGGRAGATLGTEGSPIEQDYVEQRTSETELMVHRILAATPAMVYIYDLREQRFLYANAQLTRTLGYTPNARETQGADWFFRVVDPEDLKRVAEDIAELGQSVDEWRDVEVRVRHRTGEWRWLRSRHAAFSRDAHGKVLQILGFSEDITERRASEEALRSKTEEVERFFALSLDLLCIADIRGTFCRLNSAWEHALGIPLNELVDTRLVDWVHADDRASTETALAELGQGRQVASFTNRLRCKDGGYRWVDWRATPTERQLVHAVGRDITDRVEQEQERLRLAERMREVQKLESVGRLAGGIAHDFNNLLTCISGNLSLVLMDLAHEDPLYEILMEVNGAADSAAKLTRQLLAFSRRQLVTPTVIDMNGLVERVQQMLVRMIGEDIDLSSNLQSSLGRVKIDVGQLEQVLLTLALNARDAMPDGGSLLLQTADVAFGAEYVKDHPDVSFGEYVMLEVRDTGEGMGDEAKQHLFEPFFTTKPKDKGTGLGLATAYGVIKQAGGTIEVSSELGRGTSVRIYLPRVTDRVVSSETAVALASAATGAETVLLVEDELVVLRFAERSLRRLGYAVLACSTANEALDVASNHDGCIDILVTDVVMPGMNGRVLADHIQRMRPETRILFASGYTENVIGHHGVIEPGLALLAKPYTVQGIAAKIREVLTGRNVRA